MAAPARSSATTTGELIAGRYLIIDELGRGGMGAVYRARDETNGQLVALKTLEQTEERLTRLFEREYHTLASLKHPRVIEVYDFGISAQGKRFYTMELLSGGDLSKLAPLPFRSACAHLRDVAACLALLHARRLLHRDVSPRNVRLDAHGRAKLLDFGALGDFGLPREIIGTPAYMPAEAVHHLPLDQRSDLFSLGATLYFALTKRAPFAIRQLEDVGPAQRIAPIAPSQLVPDIPEALDQLVLSLLSVDPLQRPSGTAEVMDRLAAIGGLDAEPLTGNAENHLLSSGLIGRTREKQQLQQHITRALRGAGSVVIIDGASGMGRTRLANELTVDARIAGLTTLRIDALAHLEPFGTLRALSHALLEAAPLEAAASLPRHAGVLRHAVEELKTRGEPASLPKEPVERKALIQRTFLRWLLDVCESRPLLLIIDDAHEVDLDSAGALVLIAHAAPRVRLLFAVTQERDAPAPVPIQQLTRVAARIRLRSLEREDIDKLIASVFGDVPHRARLAQWLGDTGRGNPGHSLALLQQLVDRGMIRYVSGVWVLPPTLPQQELPTGLDQAVHARLDALGADALRLARMLALHRGALPLRVCVELARDQSPAHIISALDQLVGVELLVRSGDAYRCGRESTRAYLLQDVAPPELERLHAALADALMRARPDLFGTQAREEYGARSTQDLGLQLQAAEHLERGGQLTRGRELMREVAVELTVRGDGLSESVPALEAALAEYRKHGRPAYELTPLLVPLTLAGTYNDFRLSYRYGIETLDLLLDITGLRWARRLQPWLGGRLALALGLLGGWLRVRLTARSRLVASYRDVMLAVMGIGTALLGTFSVLLDQEQAKSVAARLDILRFFPDGHAVRWVHMLQEALVDVTFGDPASACEKALRVFGALRDERRVRGIREEARLQLQVGCLTPVSLAYGLRVDGKVHAVFEALDQMHTSVSRQIVAGSRAAYHGHRGERAQFIAYRDEMDMLASQAGSTWREDIGTPRQMWTAHVLCEDVMGLKRAAHDLQALADELPSLRKLRDATQACYMCERGMHREALAEYRAMFEDAIHDPGMQGTRFASAYARILRIAGEPARAREVCEQALARLSTANRELRVATFGVELELLLATAALGELDEAAAKLERLIDAQRDHDNPLLRGLAHKGRAQVALLQRDARTFVDHLDEMEVWFRRTENPALIGQCQRLKEQAKLAGVLKPARNAVSELKPNLPELGQVSVAFEACRGPSERLQAAIDLVLSRTGAERAYLYLLEPAGLRFAAPLVGAEPPESLRKATEARLEQLRAEPSRLISDATFAITVRDADRESLTSGAATNYTPLLLTFMRESERVVVGAIAVVAGTQALMDVPSSLLEAIARAIYAAGDVRTVYFDARAELVTIRDRGAR